MILIDLVHYLIVKIDSQSWVMLQSSIFTLLRVIYSSTVGSFNEGCS